MIYHVLLNDLPGFTQWSTFFGEGFFLQKEAFLIFYKPGNV